MCDYSLQGIRNRLAEEGETLVVHRFYTGSKGLTSPKYLRPTEKSKGLIGAFKKMLTGQIDECAVCIPDGARLILHDISPKLQQAHALSANEGVRFRQLSAEAATYRDAVEFGNGVKVRLQDFEEGQTVAILALSSEEIRFQQENMISVNAPFGKQA
jgi:hypothetical protein